MVIHVSSPVGGFGKGEFNQEAPPPDVLVPPVVLKPPAVNWLEISGVPIIVPSEFPINQPLWLI